MKACILHSPAPVETNPLVYEQTLDPKPRNGEVLVRVRACGVCRTDLHVVEGELPRRKSPVVPGHEVVGTIEKAGNGATRFHAGARVGIPWLHQTCGVCEYCRAEKENLCENPMFTGYTADGGYAEYVVAPEKFIYPIPDSFADGEAAPLLCRNYRLSSITALRNPAGREAWILWIWCSGPCGDPGGPVLEG